MFKGLVCKLVNRKLRNQIKHVPRNYRTSIYGAGLILLGVAQVVVALFDDNAKTNPNWEAAGALILTGGGLISSGDSKNVKDLQDKTEK